MPRILVTNDDGVHSDGIHALADALRAIGDVIVVAPHIEASAIGHALTLRRPLRVEQLRDNVYEVDGTPTDCVNIAFTKIFTEQKQELPIPTRILLGISNGVAASWWFLLLLLVAAGFALNAALRRPASRLWLDRKLLALPIVGSLVTRIAVARFARTLGTLIENGIPLLAALDVAGGVTGHPAMAAAVEDARTAVREGQPLAAPLRQSGLFPPLLIHMIAVGERSGEVEAMLDKAADSYEQEVESSLATLTATLEPAFSTLTRKIVPTTDTDMSFVWT